jgi:hypothetical protein
VQPRFSSNSSFQFGHLKKTGTLDFSHLLQREQKINITHVDTKSREDLRVCEVFKKKKIK